jgi:hypothetical protein
MYWQYTSEQSPLPEHDSCGRAKSRGSLHIVIHTSMRVTSREYVHILSIHEVQDKDPGPAPVVEYELG